MEDGKKMNKNHELSARVLQLEKQVDALCNAAMAPVLERADYELIQDCITTKKSHCIIEIDKRGKNCEFNEDMLIELHALEKKIFAIRATEMMQQ
jgi:hypothetical protein